MNDPNLASIYETIDARECPSGPVVDETNPKQVRRHNLRVAVNRLRQAIDLVYTYAPRDATISMAYPIEEAIGIIEEELEMSSKEVN